VLPPVEVAGWTAEELSERIEEVRSAYVELLAAWPDGAGGSGGAGSSGGAGGSPE
jgi:hypothetical protein